MAPHDQYTLELAPPTSQDSYRLLELPAELLFLVENASNSDLSLTIKGKHSDDAVLCSTSATYALRAVSLSNSFLIVSPVSMVGDSGLDDMPVELQVRGQVKEIIETSRVVPRLDRLGGLLKGTEWTGDDEDTRDERPAKRRRYTYDQVSGVIQASEAELADGLRQGHIVEVNGELRPVPPSQLADILEALLTSIVASGFSPNHIPLEPLLDAMEEDHDLPREVVLGILRWYGDVSTERWRMDVEEIVREVGLGLLAEHRDEAIEESELLFQWEKKVGDSFANDVSLELLGGFYLPPLPPTRSIKYFPHTSLPTTPAARFADLFLARTRWRGEHLEPFLKGLPGGEEKAGRDAMLVKYARRSEGDDGVWWCARANYT